MWALNVLKNLPSNALVESRFSTAARAKSSYRMNMDEKRLAGTIMMRDEPPFDEVQFPELMEEMLPSVKASLNKVCGKRSHYKHSQEFNAKKQKR